MGVLLLFSGKDTCCTHPLSARMLVSLVESVDLCVCVLHSTSCIQEKEGIIYCDYSTPISNTHTMI